MPLVPVIPRQKVVSWPRYEYGPTVPYVDLAHALAGRYTTDAHFAAYSAPTVKRRLCLDAIRNPESLEQLSGGVDMALALFDVDRHDTGDVEAWWLLEKDKLACLLSQHVDGFVYRTRGGYRIVYQIEPVTLSSETDARLWTRTYLAWCVHLKSRFRIDCDPACAEWVRLFRLPHATRDGNTEPEDLATIGRFTHVGVWEPVLSEYDFAVADSFRKRKEPAKRPGKWQSAGDGVLFYAFRSRGWIGSEVERGKWSVQCPWEREHSGGDRFNSSTILYAPGHGESLGWLKCSHAHCVGRTAKDVLGQFSEWELDRAAQAAGVK